MLQTTTGNTRSSVVFQPYRISMRTGLGQQCQWGLTWLETERTNCKGNCPRSNNPSIATLHCWDRRRDTEQRTFPEYRPADSIGDIGKDGTRVPRWNKFVLLLVAPWLSVPRPRTIRRVLSLPSIVIKHAKEWVRKRHTSPYMILRTLSNSRQCSKPCSSGDLPTFA
jgi:hypothetical protein